MVKDFHNKPFDDETILKLEIFKGYIREWIVVFLSNKIFDSINICDFFAGPGRDCNGAKGSPLIIIDEVKKCLENPALSAASDVEVKVLFNDEDKRKITLLQKEIGQVNNFKIETTALSFEKSFNEKNSILESPSEVKLVILDQSGIKQITPHTFKELIRYPSLDFIFFISSFTLKRFITVEKVKRYFPNMSTEEIDSIPATDIHRFVCQYYKKFVPSDTEYYVAPFSIKKGANIYGIIFGSGKLLGLEKFLKVCWDQDKVSGEANYDIDDDILRQGETLFPELNISHKIDLFKKRLFTFLQKYRSNNELYQFTLENGCLPTHTFAILEQLRTENRLETEPADTRKRSYYISWKYYKSQEIKAKFRIV